MNDCLSIYSGQIYSFTNVTQSVTFYATRYFLKTFNVFRCISSSQLSWNTLHLFHLFSSLHVWLLLDPFNNLVNSRPNHITHYWLNELNCCCTRILYPCTFVLFFIWVVLVRRLNSSVIFPQMVPAPEF